MHHLACTSSVPRPDMSELPTLPKPKNKRVFPVYGNILPLSLCNKTWGVPFSSEVLKRHIRNFWQKHRVYDVFYELTFQSGRLRIFRVTCTALLPKLLCPKANTTVSSAPIPRVIPRLRNSMASFANLNRV